MSKETTYRVDGGDGEDREDGEKWDEWDEWDKWKIPHQALAPPFIPAPAHLNQRTNFLSEGIRYNARRISRRWAVLDVLPIDEIIR